MLYTIQKTSQRGQVLFQSVKTHGDNGITSEVSLLMPEKQAQQIVNALNFVESVADCGDKEIDLILNTNVKETFINLVKRAKEIIN